MKRIFAAIKIHPSDEFIRIYNDLKHDFRQDKIKWVELNNFHITLKFFGETDPELIPDIIQSMESIVSSRNSFSITLQQMGIFGSSYRPKVLWFGIDKNAVLNELGMKIINEMEYLGFKNDRQNFVPHLTLGRIKYIDNKKNLSQIVQKYKSVFIQQEIIKEVVLFESILKPQGPEYNILRSFSLIN